MEQARIAAVPVDEVNVPSQEATGSEGESVPVVVDLGRAEFLALDAVRNHEMRKLGAKPDRAEVIRRAIQFYYEKHQEVII